MVLVTFAETKVARRPGDETPNTLPSAAGPKPGSPQHPQTFIKNNSVLFFHGLGSMIAGSFMNQIRA